MNLARKLRLQGLAARFQAVDSGVLDDSPELQLTANLAGIDASRLLRAFNDPEHFSMHCSAAEVSKFGDALGRIDSFARSMPAAIDIALSRDQAHKATKGRK